QPHAEVFARKDAGTRAMGATASVAPEPGSHTGRAPPCARARIESGVPRVARAGLAPPPPPAGRGGAPSDPPRTAPTLGPRTAHVAKPRNRTRGSVGVPMVVRIPYGGGIGGVEHHSDSSEAYYAHTPGLKVVVPATVADAYSLLREAIDDPDPVIFMEPKKL